MLQLKDCYNEDGFKYITKLWREKTVRIRDEKEAYFFLSVPYKQCKTNKPRRYCASQQKVWELISSNRMENRFVEWLSYNTCYLGITQYKCARLA